nr:hypothetical protein [Mucilaginibacter sp. X4EP1]
MVEQPILTLFCLIILSHLYKNNVISTRYEEKSYTMCNTNYTER